MPSLLRLRSLVTEPEIEEPAEIIPWQPNAFIPPPSTYIQTDNLDDSDDSDSSAGRIGVYVIVAFFGVLALCISAFALYRWIRPSRGLWTSERATQENKRRRETHDVNLANRRAREARERLQRTQRITEELVAIRMTGLAHELAREARHSTAMSSTPESTLRASAEAFLTRPEFVLQRRRSLTASFDMASRPATPLPKYSRADPLGREEVSAGFHHNDLERCPNYTERSSTWEDRDSADSIGYFGGRAALPVL